jgi:hypothetical protein
MTRRHLAIVSLLFLIAARGPASGSDRTPGDPRAETPAGDPGQSLQPCAEGGQVDARSELAKVRVSEVTIHGDMECFKVETPTATYLYGKRGAGFAGIRDREGRDWVSYRPGGKARGEYRGLPWK